MTRTFFSQFLVFGRTLGTGVVDSTAGIALLAFTVFSMAVVVLARLDLTGQVIFSVACFVTSVLLNYQSSRLVTLILGALSIAVALRYFLWRLTATVPFGTWHECGLGLMLLVAESYSILTMLLTYLQTAWPLNRRPIPPPADPATWPTVDVLIPTYNEPLSVVAPTILAALNLDYPADKLKVWLLDDGRRPEFKAFAESVGARYITRSDNKHAKAGNLNNAMKYCDGEIIALFDCDHIPTRAFLQMTIGWLLSDKRMALVQTPHLFYSADPFERNLTAGRDLPNEGSLFYGLVQPGNDLWNAAFFCGSCALLRRSAVEEIGGFAVETVTEDAHTAMRLHRHGHHSAYLNIPLAAGLATERMAMHVGQRIRWARGMIQILRTDNPGFGPGLTLLQRLCYFNAMLHFLFGIPRIIFLTAPVWYLVFGFRIVDADGFEMIAYVIPVLLHGALLSNRTMGKYRYSFWQEIYETSLAIYLIRPTIATLWNPRKGKFVVTGKGERLDKGFFDTDLVRPHLYVGGILLFANGCGIFNFFRSTDEIDVAILILNLVWVTFNSIILLGVLAVAMETRQIRQFWRMDVALPVTVFLPDGRAIGGFTRDLSMGGAQIALPRPDRIADKSELAIALPAGAGTCVVRARMIRWSQRGLFCSFQADTVAEKRALTMAVFGRADAWIRHAKHRPDSFWRSAWLIITSIVGMFRMLLQKDAAKPAPQKTQAGPAAAPATGSAPPRAPAAVGTPAAPPAGSPVPTAAAVGLILLLISCAGTALAQSQPANAPPPRTPLPPPAMFQPPAGATTLPPGIMQAPPGSFQPPPGAYRPPAGTYSPAPGVYPPQTAAPSAPLGTPAAPPPSYPAGFQPAVGPGSPAPPAAGPGNPVPPPPANLRREPAAVPLQIPNTERLAPGAPGDSGTITVVPGQAVQGTPARQAPVLVPGHGIPAINTEAWVVRPVTGPLPAPYARGNARTITLEDLGERSEVRLLGARASRTFTIRVPHDEVVTAARLVMVYSHSPGLIFVLSHIEVVLNGEPLFNIVTRPETADRGFVEMDLAPSLFLPENKLTFKFVGSYTLDCEDPVHQTLWATLGKGTSLSLVTETVPLPEDLRLLPLPFLDPVDRKPRDVSVILPRSPSDAILHAAGLIASWFGVEAPTQQIRFRVGFDAPSDAHALVLAMPGEVPGGGRMPEITGPTVTIVRHPNFPDRKLLMVLGRDPDELLAAAGGLAFGAKSLAGPRATLRPLAVPERKPYDAPFWIGTDRPVRFGELVSPESLQGYGPEPGALTVPFRAAPDLYVMGDEGLRLHLKYRPPMDDWFDLSKSHLDVLINNLFIKSLLVHHTEVKGPIDLQPRPDFHLKEAEVHIPPYYVFAQNLLALPYFFTVKEGHCRNFVPFGIRSSIDPASTLDLTNAVHYGVYPNIGYFVGAVFPFTRSADLSETRIVLPDNPGSEVISSYLNVMALAGQATGVPVYRPVLNRVSRAGEEEGRDVILFGTFADLSAATAEFDNSPIKIDTGRLRIDLTNPLARIFTLLDGAGWTTDADKANRLLVESNGDIGVLFSAAARSGTDRVMVAVTGSTPAMVERIAVSLFDPEMKGRFQGDLAVLGRDRLDSFRVGPTFHIGTVPILMRIRMLIYDNPLSLFFLALITSALLGSLTFLILRNFAKKRLKADVAAKP